MNRRTFLLAVGATACGTESGQPKPPRPPRGNGQGSAGTGRTGGEVDPTLGASQVRASAIALRGDVLVQAAGGELRTYDARTLRRTETRDLAPNHFCFARDGSLIVYSHPANAAVSKLYRIGPSRNLETFAGPLVPQSGRNVVLPGRTAAQVYVAVQDLIVSLAIGGGRVEEVATLKHPAPNAHNRDQLVARVDGSIVAPDREPGLRLIAPDGTGTSYAMTGRRPFHLAGASKERVWYSHAPREERNANGLALAAVDKPLVPEHAIDLAPLRISHLATGGGAVVALAVEARDTELHWKLVVIGDDGMERWRVDVPAAFARGAALTSGFVAIDERRVVVSTHDHALLGWDAATGRPLS